MSVVTKGSLVISKLSIIMSSSLAQNSFVGFYGWVGGEDTQRKPEPFNHTNRNETNVTNANNYGSCSDPCAELQSLVNHAMLLIPFGITLLFFIVGALPVLFLRSRHRVYGVRSCLWVLIELWVHLLISYSWFTFKGDRAQAYVWVLHASAYILATWQPKKGIMQYPGLQKAVSLAGIGGLGLFAWQLGPPVGLAAWYRRSDAQCGWAVHLTAIIGVELIGWLLGPFETVVNGIS
jgi:hypothetical protein